MKMLHHGDTEARRTSGNWIQNTWSIFRAVLAEIFDESSYARFLERTGSARSKESYQDFMRERAITLAEKPRCC
jgi:hypothetical protein